jgi:hypothetical protein
MNSTILQNAKREYYAQSGGRWRDEDVRAYAPELGRLQMLTDLQIVMTVREAPEKYPEIHKRLCWNDATAAEMYRRLEVQDMRRSVMVRIIPDDGSEVVETRAFLRVTQDAIQSQEERSSTRTPRIGITIDRALEHREEVGSRVIAEAKSFLLGWRRRYRGYVQLFAEDEPILLDLFERIGDLEKPEEERVYAAATE